MNILLLISLFSAAFAQQLVPLNQFKGGSEQNRLPGTAPYGIYVSAYSDASSALLNIFVVSDGAQKSLSELKNRKVNGELTVYTITDKDAYLTTTLTNNDMQRLKGVIFISSSNQLNDKNFHVFDISSVFSVSPQSQGQRTYLFLNTHYGTNPYRSSIISQWKQDQNTVATIYPGVPTDAAEGYNRQIFSNPVQSDNKFSAFIANVEKFSLSVGAFYMKTQGSPGFRVEPGYWNINGMTTSALSTTGFYMKANGQPDNLVKVHVKRDGKNGKCGVNMLGSLPTGKKVTTGIYDGASKYEESSPGNPFYSPWSVPYIGENFQFSSDGGDTAEYYVQYFVSQGSQDNNPTLPPSPTLPPGPIPTVPGHVETSTKSAGFLKLFLISLVFIRFL
uniref:GH131_N domain-containing protein n=1 Tax=Caenorhabditis tropicalis TaxID=1561998 RepID=A0A1I7SZP9_9PELO